MRSLLLLSLHDFSKGQSKDKNLNKYLRKDLRELEIAAGSLLAIESKPVQIVSRDGPTESEKKGKKKGKEKGEKIPERGFKTYHLHEAIESWQYKFKDVQEDFNKMDKKALKALVSEGRLLNLKSLLAEMLGDSIADNDEQGVNKFCDYGCYCIPLDSGPDKYIGKGKPVDEIDQLCMDLWNCYRCAKHDQGKHCDGQNNYDWYAKVNGKIKCGDTDHNDSCQGQICQCDMQFANRLRIIHDKYSPEFHKDGGFNRSKKCRSTSQKSTENSDKPEKEPTIAKARPQVKTECCGTGIGRSPFKSDRSECCADGRIALIGEC